MYSTAARNDAYEWVSDENVSKNYKPPDSTDTKR